MPGRKELVLRAIYAAATVQFAWCYLWLTRAYVNTALYERGLERMPFQGRMLMMLPMRWAHGSMLLHWLTTPFAWSRFWFPRPVAPEVLVQAVINVTCLLVTGWLTVKIYEASSELLLLTPVVYPLVLVACAVTYMMHTVQNFRFLYDLPSLAFFAGAMYLIYFRRHWGWFAALFLVATVNRETTLLLLPLYMLDGAVDEGRLQWRLLVRRRTLMVVVPLGVAWLAWQVFVRHLFRGNASEFYPRISWNVKSVLALYAWPQMLSACGYLMVFVVGMRKRIQDAQLRAWLWLLPVWMVFMFVFGILIETRVFGELIPFIVCASALIGERILFSRMEKLVSMAEFRRSPRVISAGRLLKMR